MMDARRRGLVLLLTHAVLIQIIIFGMRPALSYAALGLGSSPAFLGFLSAFYALPALFLALPAGRIVDVIGERRGLVIGAVTVSAAAAIAVVGVGSLFVLMIAAVILGCGQMFTVLGQQSYVGAISSAKRSDAAFGLYGFAAALGQTVGPLMLALPGGTPAMPPVALIFTVSLGCAVLMLLVSLLIRTPPRAAVAARAPMLRAARGVLSTKGLPHALVAGSLVLASVDIFIAYAPLVGHDRGLSAVVISVMLVARSAFSMFSRLFLGVLSKAFGRRWLLVGSILLSGLMLAGFVFDVPTPVLIAFSCGYGFVVGICQPITMSWISLIAPPGTRALAMSMRLAANRLGQTVLPAALGVLAAAAGAAGVLGASGGMLMIAAWAGTGVPDDPGEGTETEEQTTP
ncbi:MFS transporter [Microbacterium terrisoli]|uniref:MFS transporter n=1 Tax=Microbacterium terrisoli TaxID=3242192 RepID=UPI002803B3AE|nr:MFS transporter [Microbacterium protaetiae]